MTNYTKTTDFAAKDSLPSGDSGKIIRGTEFETEFDNIATAVNSKSDANNPTFTGTVTIDGLTVNGNTVLGNAATDTVTVTADIASNLIPSADDTYNLGAVGAEWNDLYVDGVAYIDTIDGFATSGDVTFTGASYNAVWDTSDNALEFADSAKATFGATGDLQIYHSGTHSFITDVGTGNLYLRGTNLLLTSAAGETYADFIADGAARLYYDGSAKLATTSTGVDVTGVITTDGMTTSADINFGDNDKAIFGAGSDLQIYHDGSNSYIDDDGAGSLFLRADNQLVLKSKTQDENFLQAIAGGEVRLFHDGSQKLRTEATGIDVNGTLVSDGLTVDGTATISEGSSGASASSDSDALVVENSGNAGMSILSPDGSNSQLRFGDVTDSSSAFVQYNSTDNVMTVGTSRASGELRFTTGNAGERVRIDSAGNVGIGTSSPSNALTVVDANAYGQLRLSSSDADATTKYSGLSFDQYTASEEGYAGILGFSDNDENRIAIGGSTGTLNAATSIQFFTAANNTTVTGSERMRIDSSGNVGIGTTSPAQLLHVESDSGSDASLQLKVGDTTSSANILFGDSGATAAGAIRYRNNGNSLAFDTASSEAMRISSGGQVGIGTSSFTSGNSKLQVQGNGITVSDNNSAATAKNSRYFGVSHANQEATMMYLTSQSASSNVLILGGGTSLGEPATDIAFRTGTAGTKASGTEAMRITEDGSVGIGTSNPDAVLHANKTAASGDAPFIFENSGTSGTCTSSVVFAANGGGGAEKARIKAAVRGDGYMAFHTNDDTEKMRITSSGTLLAGKTTSASATVGVELRQNGVLIGTASSIPSLILNRTTSDGDIVDFRRNNGAVGSISVTSSATAYNTSSDQRLKENIVDAPSASDDIDAIQVRSFDWKADGSHQKYGMVAQELNTVAPEAVTEGDTEEDMMSVDYSKLVPMLVKEIQSLRARVAQLEGEA